MDRINVLLNVLELAKNLRLQVKINDIEVEYNGLFLDDHRILCFKNNSNKSVYLALADVKNNIISDKELKIETYKRYEDHNNR